MGNKKIVILYGSETGNAHDFACILSYKLHKMHFQHELLPFGDYNVKDVLQCRYMFIICSTMGQGDLPRNARENSSGSSKDTFWTFLKKKNLPPDFLNHLQTAMIGLGDSSYPNFNYAIRKIHRRMIHQLGANDIFPRLEADEIGMAGSNGANGTGVESVYFEYERRVLKFLLDKFPTRKLNGKWIQREAVPDDIYLKPTFSLRLSTEAQNYQNPIFSGDSTMKSGKVVSNKRITDFDHFQDVRHFSFETSGEKYYPGDTVSIYPHNNDADVQKFLETQPHWLDAADKQLTIEGDYETNFSDGGLISPMSLRTLVKYHCDVRSIPRRSFFMKVWIFATDISRLDGGQEQLEQQRNKLRQFALDEDMEDLYDYCNRPRRSLLEVLQDFPSLKLPWEYMLDYLPLIKPRLFSISSGPCKAEIDLTIAIVRYKTILRRIRKGLCTDYISGLKSGDQIRYKVQNNELLKPYMKKKPIVMISPGVGIAPMRCLIRSGFFDDMYLFFGNRSQTKDFLYRNELEALAESKKIRLFTCFSRDPQNSPNAKYVQDMMWLEGKLLADLILKKQAVIYICGSSGKMPVQVRLTFAEILKKWGNFDSDVKAEIYLKEMERSDRYLQETW